MDARHLNLALTTPLEQLLELPNAVRIAASAREDLQRFSPEQLQDILDCIDAMIIDTVLQGQADYSGRLVERNEQRDLDWFIDACSRERWLIPKHGPEVTQRDYFRVLALHQLGWVIDATADAPPVAFISPVVATLMESFESLMLADLLPDSPTTEQVIEDAWKTGLTPEANAADEVRKAQSQAGRQAADARHASNRAAKKKALEIYAANSYRTKEEAYRIIGAQVCKAPGTIKNWIAGVPKDMPTPQ